jgi:hypothetical protein
MALTHKISNWLNTVVYDFTTSELMISDSGWRIQGLKGGKVIETMTLFSNGARDDIIDAVNKLNLLGRMAREWIDDDRQTDAIWYYLYGDSENPKRALVYDITIISLPSGMSNPTLSVGAGIYQLAITRADLWEDTSEQALAAQTLSALGGTASLASITGDEDARFERFSVYSNSSGSIMTNGLTKLWWGMRYGNTSGFVAKHEIEDAYINPACSPLPTTQSDSTASGNVVVQWLTSATFQNICGDVLQGWFSGFPTGYTGRYLVLLRCKISTAGTVRLQFRYGSAGGEVSLGDRYITNTDYHLIEMGEINIPPGPWRAAAATFGAGRNSAALYIWGQHMTNQVTLSLDCLVLIPLQAHGYARDALAGYLVSGWTYGSNFFHFENDKLHAQNYAKNGATLSSLFGAVQYNGETWRYLRAGGVLVFAGERDAGQNKDDTIKVDGSYFRRYRTHADSV